MRIIKFSLIFVIMFVYLILSSIVRLILIADKYLALKTVNYLTFALMHLFKVIGGIKISVTGEKDILKKKNLFIICAHTSYLDGVMLGTLVPGSFTTKSEIRKIPFLGQVVSVGGSIFIDRNGKKDIVRYIDSMVDRLENNINVFNFPEGHATDGTKILPFFKAFFDAPLRAHSTIIPITIIYSKVNGSTDFNRDEVYCYDGKVSIIKHLWNLMKFKSIDVSITIHDKIQPNGHEANSKGRGLVSDLCLKRLSNYKNLPVARTHPLKKSIV